MSLTCVFAYGSNMDPDDYRAFCRYRGLPPGNWARSEVAELPGHRLQFDFWSERRGGGVANVVVEPSSSVVGLAVWVDTVALATLDEKEGYPHIYGRHQRTLRLSSGDNVPAWIYVVHAEHTMARHLPPTAYYLGLMLRAAERHEFPDWYRSWLESVLPTPEEDEKG